MTTTNTYFLNNVSGHPKAISVPAASLVKSAVPMTGDASVNFEMMNGNLKPVAKDMVFNVLDINCVYNITNNDPRLSGAVSEVLFAMLMKEVEENGAMLPVAATEEVAEPKTLEELVEMYNIEEVVIKGVNITEGKVVAMMGAAGLTIGGRCENKLGQATILGFEAGLNGVLVVVVIDGEDAPRKLMADKVKAIGQTTGPVSTRSEEDDLLASEIAKLMSAPTGGVEVASRAAVSEAIFAGGMTIRTVEDELSEAERFELEESERMAGRQKWIDERKANATKVSGSEAAQRILALANQQLKGGEAPQDNKDKGNGQSTRRPGPSAQQQTQTDGGNVQMETKTQDRPVQGVAGGKAVRRPQAGAQQQNASAPVQTPTPSNNGKSQRRPQAGAQAPAANNTGRARLNTGAIPGNSNGRTGGTRLGAGAPIAGGAQRPAGTVGLRVDTPFVGNGAGGKWFEDVSRLPLVISGEAFEQSRQNLELGITDAKFYEANAYAEYKGFTARENDLATIVLSFGPELTFEFQIKISSSPEARQPWYCSNVSFIKSKRGTGGYWAYVVGRRQADAILIERKGEWVMATPQEAEKANKNDLWTVKGAGWVNDTIYGMRMGEQIIAQVMRFADYAWSAMFVTEVEAE